MFALYFPSSPFLGFLQSHFTDYYGENAKSDKEKVVIAGDIKVLTDNSSIKLSQLLNKHFSESYVFVDVWATWCAPCVSEFDFAGKVYKYLSSKDIQLIYLSIDKTETETKWRKIISKRKLSGSHLLINPALFDDLKNTVYRKSEITIPRYLLYNRNGVLIDDNIPGPSEWQKFTKRISNKMK